MTDRQNRGGVGGDLDAVGHRVGTALARVADRYTPSFELDQIVDRSARPERTVEVEHVARARRRHHGVARYAAALVVIAGVAVAIVQGDRSGGDSIRSASPGGTQTTVPDGNLIDAIDTTPPEQLAILDPAPGDLIPQRANPYFTWLMGEPDPEPGLQRAFAVVGDDGLPTAALVLVDQPDQLDLLDGWENYRDAGVDGVDARITETRAVSWPGGNGLITVRGSGDADLDAVTDFAAQVVEAGGVTAAPVPAGFTELGEIQQLGWVNYGNGAAPTSLTLYQGDGARSWWMLQFIGADDSVEALPGDDGWVFSGIGGASNAWIDAGDGLWVSVVSPIDPIDPARIASQIRIVPGNEVRATPIADAWTFDMPDNAELAAAGELATGPFLVVNYDGDDTNQTCIHVVFDYEPRGFPHSRSCEPGGEQHSDCWTVHDPYSDAGDPYVVWVDDVVDTITVTINGEPVASAVEHVDGLTLASGTSPQPIDNIEATTGSDDIC